MKLTVYPRPREAVDPSVFRRTITVAPLYFECRSHRMIVKMTDNKIHSAPKRNLPTVR